MCDDIPAKVAEEIGIQDFYVNSTEMQGYILYEIQAILHGFRKSLKEFGLPDPPLHLLKGLNNKLPIEENNYKRDLLMQAKNYFGTRKTLLWKTITSTLRSEGKIVLAVVSSGIASLLLIAGCTTHSQFKIPLELTDKSLCHIKNSAGNPADQN
ncbi:DNA helicase [Tanacetum coccineum]